MKTRESFLPVFRELLRPQRLFCLMAPQGGTEEGWVLESDVVWAGPPWEDQCPVKTRGGLLGVFASGFLGAIRTSGPGSLGLGGLRSWVPRSQPLPQ